RRTRVGFIGACRGRVAGPQTAPPLASPSAANRASLLTAVGLVSLAMRTTGVVNCGVVMSHTVSSWLAPGFRLLAGSSQLATSPRPSLLKARKEASPFTGISRSSAFLSPSQALSTSQRRIVAASGLADARILPSGEKASPRALRGPHLDSSRTL